MEEKDLFDLFRESSEELTEQPSQETWQRLETRLARKRTTVKRPPLLLQLNVVVTVVLLLLGVAAIGLYITKEHEATTKANQQFAALRFLEGKWTASDGKIGDELVFSLENREKNTEILRGVKTVSFDNLPVSKDTILIEKTSRNVHFIYFGKKQALKKMDNHIFDFEDIRLRQADTDRFSLSFGEGAIFLYRRVN
jgi:hypothetical protein